MSLTFEPSSLLSRLSDISKILSEFHLKSEDLQNYIDEADSPDDYDDVIINNETVFDFSLPETDDSISLAVNDLESLTKELQSAKTLEGLEFFSSKRYLLRTSIHYNPDSNYSNELMYNRPVTSYPLNFLLGNNEITCQIKTGITLFSIMAGRDMYWDKYIPPVLGDELFVEVSYTSPISLDIAKSIAYAYLFEINIRLNIILEPSPRPAELMLPDIDCPDDYPTLHPLLTGKGLLQLQTMFLQASYSTSYYFKVITYTKILEFVSQTVTRNEINELIFQKIYRPEAMNKDPNFVKELEDAFDEFRKLKKDNELIKLTINRCCDYSELHKLVVGFIKQKIGKNEKASALETIARIIISTRNKASHAKSNYRATGDECPEKELENLCAILSVCARQSIFWFNTQSESLRMI